MIGKILGVKGVGGGALIPQPLPTDQMFVHWSANDVNDLSPNYTNPIRNIAPNYYSGFYMMASYVYNATSANVLPYRTVVDGVPRVVFPNSSTSRSYGIANSSLTSYKYWADYGSDDFTVSTWINPLYWAASYDGVALMGNIVQTPLSGWGVWCKDYDGLPWRLVFIYVGIDDGVYRFNSEITLQYNVWGQYTVSKLGSTLSIYYNGVKYGEGEFVVPIKPTTKEFHIMNAYQIEPWYGVHGYWNETRTYHQGFTDAEILADFEYHKSFYNL